jgi:hypothetical protein
VDAADSHIRCPRVWQVGDKDHIKVLANADAAETWFAENDPEGVAFEYELMSRIGRWPSVYWPRS